MAIGDKMGTRTISNRSDVEFLVREFYSQLLVIPHFKHIFEEVAELDILAHMDVLCDFWESVLFGTGSYKKNAMKVHVDLHVRYPLSTELFEEWLSTFSLTVDTHFEGEVADEAKLKARSIAAIMQMKISNVDKTWSEINS